MRLENAVLVPEILIRQLEKHIILTAMKVKQIDRVELKRRGFISSFSGSSGIIYSDGFVYIIADKSNVLSVFDVNDQTLKKEISLKADGSLEANVEKKYKPDFEAFSRQDNRYFIFGSGSAKNRFDLVILDERFDFVERLSIENLYLAMMESTGIETSAPSADSTTPSRARRTIRAATTSASCSTDPGFWRDINEPSAS